MLEGDTVIKFSTQLISFDRFIAEYIENSEHPYELHSGVVIEMLKPRGKHSEIAGFLSFELGLECRNRQYPFVIPKECIIKPLREESGYEPDVIVLDGTRFSENFEEKSLTIAGNFRAEIRPIRNSL